MALLNLNKLIELILLVLEVITRKDKEKEIKDFKVEIVDKAKVSPKYSKEDIEKAVKIVLAEVGENSVVN